jgi:transposase
LIEVGTRMKDGTIIGQLAYKTCGAIQVDEHYTSQHCPQCGSRSKQRRIYRCRTCGIVAPRDVIRAINILSVGRCGALQLSTPLPTEVRYARPVNVSRRQPGSLGGHPRTSSAWPRSPRL